MIFTKKKTGFTLIELLVVIAIIALLASIVLIALGGARTKARDAKRTSDIHNVITALELYYGDQGSYPNTGDGGCCGHAFTDANTVSALVPTYLASIPVDPLHTGSYNYSYASSNGTNYAIDLFYEQTPTGAAGPYQCRYIGGPDTGLYGTPICTK
jgi:type II secretion system protein G